MIRRIKWKWLTLATVCGGAGFTIVEWNRIEYLGVIRGTRAASTVMRIAAKYLTEEKQGRTRSETHTIAANMLLNLCLTNKGVYIKVGQHIGALDYLLPSEFVDTMKVLHKDAPPNTVDQLYAVIKEDLHKNPEELFEEFEPEPLGTASLAQVHKAKLKDGTTVAVKVQHQYVKENTKADIRSMEALVHIMSWIFPDFSIQWLVDETKKNIFHELDFSEEGHNAEKVGEMFKDYPWLKIPKVYWDYSTKRVLVMEYVTGGQINDLKYMQDNRIDPYDICRRLGDLYSHMIFVNGFVHSDPHPGNILVNKDPQTGKPLIYLLDHGLYANLTEDFRYHYSQFWLSIINKNQDGMKFHAEKLGIEEKMYIALACIVSGRPWAVIMKGIDQIKPDDKERAQVKDSLPNVIDQIALCLQNIDRQALLVLKTNDLMRSIEYSLKTSQMMCGFMVMSQCCMQSVYNTRIRTADSLAKKFSIRVTRLWELIRFYLFYAYLGIMSRFTVAAQ